MAESKASLVEKGFQILTLIMTWACVLFSHVDIQARILLALLGLFITLFVLYYNHYMRCFEEGPREYKFMGESTFEWLAASIIESLKEARPLVYDLLERKPKGIIERILNIQANLTPNWYSWLASLHIFCKDCNQIVLDEGGLEHV